MLERWLVAVNGKTEAIYVNALKQRFRSSAVEVKHFAKDPLQQVTDAEGKCKSERTKFARVYIVFDEDDFDLKPALEKIEMLNQGSRRGAKHACKWIPIISTPCFELWYLLHFRYTNAAFSGQTPCRDLQSQFPKEFEGYAKVDPKHAKELVETRLDDACANAKKLESDPSSSKTAMYKLVEALRDKNSAAN